MFVYVMDTNGAVSRLWFTIKCMYQLRVASLTCIMYIGNLMHAPLVVSAQLFPYLKATCKQYHLCPSIHTHTVIQPTHHPA